jgi:predicted SprT family Zn-dependent metalloprotease
VLPDVATLQLLFAQLNNECFGGEIPAHRIAYSARFSNLAGRITYKPPLIELSRKHFERSPEALRETLLHEMIHAWLFARGDNPGHTPAFKRKMRALGLHSIHHDLGSALPRRESSKRFILRCGTCTMELLRKRRPPANVSCGRCSGRRFDPRYVLRVFEVIELREAEPVVARAANRSITARGRYSGGRACPAESRLPH